MLLAKENELTFEGFLFVRDGPIVMLHRFVVALRLFGLLPSVAERLFQSFQFDRLLVLLGLQYL